MGKTALAIWITVWGPEFKPDTDLLFFSKSLYEESVLNGRT